MTTTVVLLKDSKNLIVYSFNLPFSKQEISENIEKFYNDEANVLVFNDWDDDSSNILSKQFLNDKWFQIL